MRVIFQPAIEMNGGKRIKTLLKGIKAEEMTEYQGLKDPSDDNGGGSQGTTTPGSDSGSTEGGGSGNVGL